MNRHALKAATGFTGMAVLAMFSIAIIAGQTRSGEMAHAASTLESATTEFRTSLEQFDHAEMLFPVIDSILESPLEISVDLEGRHIVLKRGEPGRKRD